MNLYIILSFSPIIFHLHLHLCTDLNTSLSWKWVGRSMCMCLISKRIIYTPQAATVKNHEGSVFEDWVASDLSFCHFIGLLSYRENQQNLLKFSQRDKAAFFGSVCCLCVASMERAKFLPQVHVWKGMFAMGCPWLDCASNCAGHGAGMHWWLDDYCSGFLYGILYCSLSVPPHPPPPPKKKVFFTQASLPFKSFIGFLMTTYLIQTPCTGLEDSVTFETATPGVSCTCSQLCLKDCILDLSMGDLFFPSLICS